MELGLVYPSTELGASSKTVRTFAASSEQLGFDFIEAHDHVLGTPNDGDGDLWGPYNEDDAIHDPFVMFAFMAACTQRIQFATGVLVLPQRQTALVAKQAADLAVLSDGRLRLAVGVGWNDREYRALGMDFGRRGERLDNQIPVLRSLWTTKLVDKQVGNETLTRVGVNPRPQQAIPIWIGGASQAAFNRAARLGDGFCFSGGLPRSIAARAHLMDLLEREGRRPQSFGSELVLIPPAGDRSERWPRLRPSFLEATSEAVSRWGAAGGTHATIFTQWMGLRSLDEHLEYAECVIRSIRG